MIEKPITIPPHVRALFAMSRAIFLHGQTASNGWFMACPVTPALLMAGGFRADSSGVWRKI